MLEDTSAGASWPSASKGIATGSSAGAPDGYGLRRAHTLDEAPNLKRRSPSGGIPPPDATFDAHRRRNSTFSENSFAETRDTFSHEGQSPVSTPEYSILASVALAFALIPALAGAVIKDGTAIATDVLLLGLAGVFLHLSVTQPWSWYHSAQQIRVIGEDAEEDIVEDDDDLESISRAQTPSSPLEDIPEEHDSENDSKEESTAHQASSSQPQLTRQQKSAISELYAYEIAALLSCALLPLLGAYLLHAIRAQLSRPSEGLVSNYNLTIFLLVSEFRVVSHLFKLLQSRTLHLHNVVRSYPFPTQPDHGSQFEKLTQRLDRLEARSAAEEVLVRESLPLDSGKAKQDAAITREVRNAIQPELDALNRAVRRYEKKATVLQSQTESRFKVLNEQVADAITLAAAATKINAPQKSLLTRTIEILVAMALFPFQIMIHLALLPSRVLLPLLNRTKRDPDPQRVTRSSRQGKASTTQTRYSGDRVPSRISRR